jgi:hypothetical protein
MNLNAEPAMNPNDFDPHPAGDPGRGDDFLPDAEDLARRVEHLLTVQRPRFARLWAYCRNPMRITGLSRDGAAERPYRQAQEWGLPSRITGVRSGSDPFTGTCVDGIERKEVVIENDIGWRIETMVDYLFGKSLVLESAAADPQRRTLIGELLRQILAHNGGILFLQQLALLGSVHGFVDVLVKLNPPADRAGDDSPLSAAGAGAVDSTACGTDDLGEPPADRPASTGPAPSGPASSSDDAGAVVGDFDRTRAASAPSLHAPAVARLARMIRFEIVEPARALPFLSSDDWRCVRAYGQCFETVHASDARGGAGGAGAGGAGAGGRSLLGRLRRLAKGWKPSLLSDERDIHIELITPARWVRYENGRIRSRGANSLGRIPLVHVQNTAAPFEYAGAGDVEPLIPLQDELNTRLSDRASRITLQSFKMYLGKGIENFTSLPVAPGRMWMSDNDAADVIEFGGDASSPSEDAHISDLREAMDKTSAVTPIAAGAIKGRIGNLTSAAALRVTLQALLAKTEKKRTTYGAAIEQLCELSLAWLDRAGMFRSSADERRVTINWPSPIPENQSEKLQDAEAKARLGVPREIVLRELGY